METGAFDYHLPRDLIAQHPAQRRDEARLMLLERNTGRIEHLKFKDLPGLIQPEDLMVMNDSRVIPGRLTGTKPTGGKVEITLIGRVEGEKNRWKCLAKPARRLKAGMPLSAGALEILPIGPSGSGMWIVELKAEGDVDNALRQVGNAPLPPYIHRDGDEFRKEDIDRYQTVYAREWGAVAAPTAGLHFTPDLLEEIRRGGVHTAFVTLEVGWGSFAPVREELAENHKVEAENYRVGQECALAHKAAREGGGRIVAVGTTSVRALESAWSHQYGGINPAKGQTELFILPGYKFMAVDALITNFHLPRSSLIMLAAAFAGLERLLEAYNEAVKMRYRFYSYGDAMMII